jgi:hypothetical protein
VDPARAPVERWPLWYLTEDVPLLYACWQFGIEQWGQLAAYREMGGVVHVPGRSARDIAIALDELAHVATLAERLHALCTVGRGRPVDRAALAATGVVTAAFLDAVALVADTVAGDAAQLLEALRDGAVPRFGSGRIEPLREALRTGGWLDERMSLSPEQIRWGVLARSAREDAAELVDALLERLRRGALPDPEPSHVSSNPS